MKTFQPGQILKSSDLNDIVSNISKSGVKNEIGELQDNPESIEDSNEYLHAVLDPEDHFLFGVTKDGTFTAQKSDFLTKEEGKGQIISEYADGVYIADSDEYLELHLDSNSNFLYGVRKNGDFVTNSIPELEDSVNEMKSYVDSKLKKYISLPTSAYENSFATMSTDLEFPELKNDLALIEVSNEAEFRAAIRRFNEGNSILISLKDHILLQNTCEIVGTDPESELVIDGNGNTITLARNTVHVNGYSKGLAWGNYPSGLTVYDHAFVSNTGEPLTLSRSRRYEALGRVTSIDGDLFDKNTGKTTNEVYKMRVSDDLASLNITESDNVFINMTIAWTASTNRVVKIQEESGNEKQAGGTYLYFRYTDNQGYSVDYEYITSGNLYPNFYFINLKPDSDSVFIRDNKIYFPSQYTSISDSDLNILRLNESKGLIFIKNTKFTGGLYAIRLDEEGSSAAITNCEFSHNFYSSIFAQIGSTVWCENSYFHDLQRGGIDSNYNTTVFVNNNRFKNVNLKRMNTGAIHGSGKYYIGNNHIEDYGYMAIRVGIMSMTEYYESYGIVENNFIIQTPEYYFTSPEVVVSDGGIIYCCTNNNPYSIIRYNRLVRGNGRRGRVGIYLDDGAYNVWVIGNVVQGLESYSLYGRFSTGSRHTAGLDDNVNKVFYYNVVDSPIKLEGHPLILRNGCFLGVNAISSTKLGTDHVYNYLEGQEPQIESPLITIEDGIPRIPTKMSDYRKWRIC